MLRNISIFMILIGVNTPSFTEDLRSPSSINPIELSLIGSSPAEEPTGMSVKWRRLEAAGTLVEGEEVIDWGLSLAMSFEL